MSCDQKKIFDNISHEYLFGLLKHVNLGTFMFENIKRIYTDSHTNIILNQAISNKITIKSGIKQGCALSMIFYVFAIEELIIRIKNNVNKRLYSEYFRKK
jgi:hypothetical protein